MRRAKATVKPSNGDYRSDWRSHAGLTGGDVCWLAELAQLVILTSSFGPSTIQPVVAASRLPGQLKDPVREFLVELGDDPTARPLLAHGFVDRFRPVDDGAYDDIRAMLATVEAAGWTSLTQTAIAS